ncbi:AraC family transcriptional regulator [Oleispirillum naphthae]|uniref:AraC family transcriptional regulator n=1 Tax=Oleispirillum naphthae TaxID=2838853 RepID=UPI0030825BEE
MDSTTHRPERPAPEPTRRFATAVWEAELLPRQPYEVRYTTERAAVGFAFDPQAGEHAFASDRVRPFRVRARSLAFVPAGCEVFSRSAAGGEYLRLILPSAADGAAERFSGSQDAAAARAAWTLRALLLAGGPPDPLLFDAHAAALAAHAAVPRATAGAAAGGWMTPQRLKRIEDLVEARLETGPSVAEMAAELGLSADFFSRAFKAATGETPHAYVLTRRIARARALIRAGADDLSTVAFAAGFSSHAHMSAAFRRILGVTPGALRGS